MASIGYQIVEPEILGEWLGTVKNQELLVGLLSWIANHLQMHFRNDFPNAIIEVIRITYLDSYPALGVHYLDEETPNLDPHIQAETARLLKETPVIEFVKYFFDANKIWADEVERFC